MNQFEPMIKPMISKRMQKHSKKCQEMPVNLIKRFAQKLHRIILLYLKLVTFRIHFRKIRKSIIFMVFGPSRHQDTPTNSRKVSNHVGKYDFGKHRNVGNRTF